MVVVVTVTWRRRPTLAATNSFAHQVAISGKRFHSAGMTRLLSDERLSPCVCVCVCVSASSLKHTHTYVHRFTPAPTGLGPLGAPEPRSFEK